MQKTTLNELGRRISDNAKSKGFYNDGRTTERVLLLIHSEVSEAVEADRIGRRCQDVIVTDPDSEDGKGSISAAQYCIEIEDNEDFKREHEYRVKDTVEAEVVDVIMLSLDYLDGVGADIDSIMKSVMRYNQLRPHKHGKGY